MPIPADYDGDGKTDIAIYRLSTATSYVITSDANDITVTQFGSTNSTPVEQPVGDFPQ